MPITQFSPDTLRSNITDFAKGNRWVKLSGNR